MLAEEASTAVNIKSRVNRLSVQTAIVSTLQMMKPFSRTPSNGIAFFCGEIVTADGKEKKVSISFEPHKPIQTSLYLCDNKFHVDPLADLVKSDDRNGFLIMDGSGCLYASLEGNTKNVLGSFAVQLPKKHGRGGQSAARFGRIRMEKRLTYLKKVAEQAVQYFITNDKPNVQGLILGGSAEFKNDLLKSDAFDARLSSIVIKLVDINYGGLNGLNQAIELSQDTIQNVKYIREKKVLDQFFKEIALDTGKYLFGADEIFDALESGAIEELIVDEDSTLQVARVHDKKTGTINEPQIKVFNLNDPISEKYEIIDHENFTEWLAKNYTTLGFKLNFVTDKTAEGVQFCTSFGGVGAILRYKLNFEVTQNNYETDDEFFI